MSYLGASGAMASIVTFFILNFPKETIYLYFIPVPAWMVGVGLFGYSYMNVDS
jgi:membrane associated rhomboid family serine protease